MATRKTTLLRILKICVLTVAVSALYLIHSEGMSIQIRSVRDIHPFKMIPDPIIGKPCDVEIVPDEILSHVDKDNQPSRILYLVQTEECLPTHLRSALGNLSACQCDVVVLSYRNICNDTSLPHVTYDFKPNTTWTTGRNWLYYTNIHKKSERYLYYILMDDDIVVKWRKRWQVLFESKDPWRSFEEFIRRTQPPIAALELHENLITHIEKIRATRDCCMDKEYTVTVRYDAAFNAFHYQAVEYVLPYWDKLDNMSWWNSQLHQFAWAEVVFRGQVLVHRQLIALNEIHHPYPRSNDMDSPLPMMIDDIRERVPAECRNASLLEDIARKGFEHLHTTSPTYCLPPPPQKQPIIPFRNLIC